MEKLTRFEEDKDGKLLMYARGAHLTNHRDNPPASNNFNQLKNIAPN